MSVKVANMSLYGSIAVAVLLMSQLVGYWVNNNIALNTTWEINSLIHLTHIRNYGGVFGLAQGMGWLFGLISIGLLSAVTAYLWLGSQVSRYEFVCFGFIVGGGASNILDRFICGKTVEKFA